MSYEIEVMHFWDPRFGFRPWLRLEMGLETIAAAI